VEKCVNVTRRLFDIGCAEVSIGDTIGVGVPTEVARLSEALGKAGVPIEKVALHLHDTRGTALANVWEGLRAGIRIFDSAAGGLGGCPYAVGASGNLATEDLVYLFERSGYRTGIDLQKVFEASSFILEVLGKRSVSRVSQALAARSRWPLEPATLSET
jgi:hydroxymethylglutaryl-CoA lyase